MFNQLTRYVFAQWLPTSPEAAAEGVEAATPPPSPTTRLTSAEAEDDWVLVERGRDDADSAGNSKCSSMESLHLGDDDVEEDDGLLVVERSPDRVVVVANTTASSASASLPLPSPRMDESWFLTPPPCFISTGPVHMATSPLENLLIEHPSMSVYTHHVRRMEPEPELVEPELLEDETGEEAVAAPRALRPHQLQQMERQGLRGRQAQKVQIQKACKNVKRDALNRTNKAREVNCRNQRQRRGERSQGALRSFANNNRKC